MTSEAVAKNRSFSPRGIALIYAAFSAVWIIASDSLLDLSINHSFSILNINIIKGLVFVAATAGLLYLLLQYRHAPADNAELSHQKVSTVQPTKRRLMLAFIGLVLALPLMSLGVIHLHGPRLQETAFADLRAIADLKAGQIESWMHERRSDAELLTTNEGFINNVAELVRSGDTDARRYVTKRLEALGRAYEYQTELLDTRQNILYTSTPETIHPVDGVLQELLRTAWESGQIQYRDLYRDGSGHIRLDFIVPLFQNRPTGEQQAVGAVVLHAPVERFLYPLIQTWPTPSPSAETILIRRDGDQVLFLNELRHEKNTALSLHLPLDTPHLPAAVSILVNQPQVIEGIDYRGVAVLAAVHRVQGTPWHLVAKIDRDEVMAPLNDLVYWLSVVAFFAIVSV